MIFIGIDPGLDGAIAAIDERCKLISVQDTPTLTVKKGAGKRRIHVETEMVTLLEAIYDSAQCELHGPELVIGLENVHSMPKQGVTSMFNMGVGFGIWIGIIAALRIPSKRIEPRTWKRVMGIASGAPKEESVNRALQFFPKAPLRGPKGGWEHGRADALLIAEFLRTITLTNKT